MTPKPSFRLRTAFLLGRRGVPVGTNYFEYFFSSLLECRPMAKSLGGFRAALLIGWIVLAAAGAVYAHGQGIPTGVALPVLAAFFVEYPFYLAAAFPETRKRLANSFLTVGH